MAGFGPVNGAGTSDMLMRNTNTGAFEIYDISDNRSRRGADGPSRYGMDGRWHRRRGRFAACERRNSCRRWHRMRQRRAASCKWPDRCRHPDQPGESAHRRAASVVTNLKRGTLRAAAPMLLGLEVAARLVVTLYLTICLVFGYKNLILLGSRREASRDDP